MPVWAMAILATIAVIAAPFGIGLVVRRIWRSLPPPTTFAEGQRALFGMMAAGAGIFCGAMAITMIGLLMWGGWSPEEEHTIVLIFGWTLGGFIFCMSIVMVGLLVGGPVGRFKAGASRQGLNFEASGDGEPPPQVIATATVSTPAQPASVQPGQQAPTAPPPIGDEE